MARGAAGGALDELRSELREYLASIDEFEEVVADRMGVGRTDMRCMDILERRGRMTAGALAEASGLTTGAVTFLIDRLERAGLVRRQRDTEDRRRVIVGLEPSAHRKALRLHEPLVMDLRALCGRYKAEELEIIRDFLREARAVYDTHIPLLRERRRQAGGRSGAPTRRR